MLFTFKKVTTTIIFCLLFFTGSAQTDKSIQPLTESVSENILTPIKEIVLDRFNIAEFDQTDAKNGELPMFSRSVFTNISLDNAGSWTKLPNGDRLWRVQVTSLGAQALLPYFNKFFLPIGSFLHVYSPDKGEIIGAFTSSNNPGNGYYATGLIHGESLILEYYEPHDMIGKGVITLDEVGHAYRWISRYFPKNVSRADTLGFNDSGLCEVNVNCSEGADWQNQKRSVVCIIVKNQTGQGICNGALVNNVREDCTPYLLSAQHCSEGTLTNQFSQWLFYFNFESAICSNPTAAGSLDDNFLVGCTKKADSNDNGGDDGSDFLLLQLNTYPPISYNVYYSGWNKDVTSTDSGACIHHPSGDIKKISTYTSTPTSTTWIVPSSVQNTHWRVQWSATTNGHGVTEIGSSGAPLFNKQGQIIGKLTGGDSFCSQLNAPDLFGKVAYDWMDNGTSANRQLKPWLDPDNTGISLMSGRNADCVLGVEETPMEKIFFDIFPNPSNGFYMLHFLSEDEKTIRLFDITGSTVIERVINEKKVNLNISSQARGIYILQVRSKNGTGVKKIILNN